MIVIYGTERKVFYSTETRAMFVENRARRGRPSQKKRELKLGFRPEGRLTHTKRFVVWLLDTSCLDFLWLCVMASQRLAVWLCYSHA